MLGKATKAPSAQIVETWLKRKSAAIGHVKQTLSEMRSLPEMDFATLSVALQAVRAMAEG